MAAPAIGVRPRWGAVPGVSVDWSHPMSAGLLWCVLPGAAARCLVTRATPSSPVAARTSVWGSAGNNGTAAAQYALPPSYSSLGSSSFTIGIAWQKTSGSANGAYLGIQAGANWCVIGQGGGNPSVVGSSVTGLDEGIAWRNIAGSIPDGPHAVCAVHNVGCWYDGTQTQSSFAVTNRTGWTTVWLASRNSVGGVPDMPTGDGIAVAAWWNRQLSPAEALSFTVDPFQMLRR